jgi:hypothetical protein
MRSVIVSPTILAKQLLLVHVQIQFVLIALYSLKWLQRVSLFPASDITDQDIRLQKFG